MEREIKFRAWQRKAKMFLTEDRLVNPNGVPVISEGNCFRLNHAHVDFQQFTGLKDSRGMEIFEGDIISVDADARFPVEFENGYFGVHVDKQPPGTFLIEGFWALADFTVEVKNVCRVLGNIYENPELLEKENLDVKDQAAAQ